MARMDRILLLIVAVFLLSLSFEPALGQANPELDKLWQMQKMQMKGQDVMNNLLSKHGLDYDQLAVLMSNKKDVYQFLAMKFQEMMAGARVVETASGDRAYLLAEEELEEEGKTVRLVSETCLDHVGMWLNDLGSGVYYARRMAASYGSLPTESAEFSWQLKDYGDIWMCKSTKENKTSGVPPFSGKSCTATFYELGIQWGTCWPSTCTELQINVISYILWRLILGEGPLKLYSECQEPQPWNGADIAFTTVLAFFAFLGVIGTFYELYLQERVLKKIRNKQKMVQPKVYNTYEEVDRVDEQSDIATTSSFSMDVEESASEVKVKAAKVNGGFVHDDKPPMTSTPVVEDVPLVVQTQPSKMKNVVGWQILNGILMSFSAVNNCKKLLSAKKTKDTMAVLNGLRVLSMFWIILGHSCLLYIGRIMNPAQSVEIATEFSFLSIYNSTVSVDTFFVLSGFLVTYLTLKQIDSKKLTGVFGWAVFYFHRWWRLTPVYMAAMGIWALLMPHFGQGVLTDGLYDFIKSNCRKQWWTHPLYINNLYPWPNTLDDSCMSWAWYLANDMQFFIISPIILVILHKSGKAGMALITSLMLTSLGALFGLNWHYGYSMNGQEPYNDNVPDPATADTTYAKPYTRIPTYLVGMVLGYIMFKLRGKTITIPKVVAILGWLLALGTLFSVVYGIQSGVGRYVPQAESVIYLTFHRLAWGVGIAWIIFACLLGYGGPVAVLLEWSFWVPMARLTYCAFLLHPVLVYSRILTDQILFHFTYVSIGYLFVGNVVFSYVSALILSLLIEGPTMGLEKVMFGKFKKA